MSDAVDRVVLTREVLDVESADRFLRCDRAGGVALFVGTTRRHTGDRETLRLHYEAYEPMARSEMARLLEAARTRWPLERGILMHRLGDVAPTEASVVVGVSSPHRADAFEACRYLIDRLKESVPIWKQEWLSDGTREWVEGDRPAG